MNTHLPLALFCGTLLCSGCSDVSVDGPAEQASASQVPAADTSTPTETANPPQSPKARAMAAKQALFEALSGELVAAMSSRGPAEAIKVCSQKASAIATEVSEEHGLKIGRTSFKLRNPKNVPPEWTTDFIDRREAEPQFVDIGDHTFGALLPIKLMPQCLMCHGPDDQIEPAVKTALAELYPDDTATGFQMGDLRGWFWVEVPIEPKTDEATSAKDESMDLIQFGKMHQVIGQKQHQGRVSPTELAKTEHVYAVGAIEGLSGELTIIDSEVVATTVDGDQQLAPVPQADLQATLLVGHVVSDWKETTVPADVPPDQIDVFLAKTAETLGVDLSAPKLFTVTGEFSDICFHVINGACPVHAKRSGIELPENERPYKTTLPTLSGTLVGVYAEGAAGVITHPGTSTHTHVVFTRPDENTKLTGHVESTGLKAGAVVRFQTSMAKE